MSDTPQEVTVERRREILQQVVSSYISRGYRVTFQTESTAQLIKPRTLSCLWVILFGLTLIGLIIYVIVYLMTKDEQVYIEVTSEGKVHTRVPGQAQSLEESAEAYALRLEAERKAKEEREAERQAWLDAHPGETYPADQQRYIAYMALVGTALILAIGCSLALALSVSQP